ncbi:MAG TPA: hypothetical protein VGO84_05890, partial [Burkholderiales bacterium]|nr:hypothetical protein [Burkholderiales bacterium]
MTVDIEALRAAVSKDQPPFALNKIGQVVLLVADLKRSVEFYGCAGLQGVGHLRRRHDAGRHGRGPSKMIFPPLSRRCLRARK